MRIGITSPTNWPLVRRGAERFINELAAFLAARGHEVTLISVHPGKTETRRENGFTTVMYKRLWHPIMSRAGLLEFHPFFLTTLGALPRRSFDVLLCTSFMDAYAAIQLRRFTGVPCIFWVNGLPPLVHYYKTFTLKGAVFRRTLLQADEVVALSSYMQKRLGDGFGRAGVRIPPPVEMNAFPLVTGRDHTRPTILCAAALEDQRKGGRFLMRGFNRLKQRCPSAVLNLSGETSEGTARALLEMVLPEWRDDVHFLGTDELKNLPAVYGRATVSVLPSMWEPFGLVLTESLAVGTPVVGTRDGAIPEIISNPSVGRLFEPGSGSRVEPENVEGFVEALLEAIELSRLPETAHNCRAHAELFSWSVLGRELEGLLKQTADRCGPKKTVPAR